MEMKDQKFGVEVEFTGISREAAATVLADYFGTTHRYAGGSYDAWEVQDEQGRTWKVMYDSSITPEKKRGRRRVSASSDHRCELVTPILRYADIEDLQEIIRKLRKKGAIANDSCGIHVHVDAAPHTPQTLRNLVNLVASKEDILYRALGVKSCREHYCKKADKDVLRKLNEQKPRNMYRMERIWYGTDCPSCRHSHYDSTRYHGVNLHATFTKGTVEFRLFNTASDTGHLHAGELRSYVLLSLAISHQALIQKRASYRPMATDNEKYAMRCWLLRMGMIGDEFKNVRMHLLKRLEGNSAWRNAA